MERIGLETTITIRGSEHEVMVEGLYYREPQTRHSPEIVEVEVEYVTCIHTNVELLDHLSERELEALEDALAVEARERGGP